MAAVEVTYAEVRQIHPHRRPAHRHPDRAPRRRGPTPCACAGDVRREARGHPDGAAARPRSSRSPTTRATEIRKNLNDLYLLAGLITAIVFVMIFAVLRRLTPSLLILSSIAFSIVITFNLIYAFGISLNMLTLGALALGFGMFVDNSIVVFENTLRLREGGMEPARGGRPQGPREVFVAVLASTLTTMAVFFSFPFFQGKLKMYYQPLAIVVGLGDAPPRSWSPSPSSRP
ncbi:MAG: efflux RND transporter permease subunit [Chromatiales bacterium]|nr:efflux RND transporter permease subunit [Chromatiales bacterium]